MQHPSDLPDEQLYRQCQSKRSRKGGPGGQHRNKVETCVALLHTPTGVRAEASERRSQEENRLMAIKRLKIQLAIEVRSVEEVESIEPARMALWRQYTRGGLISINESNPARPSLLALVMDVLAIRDYNYHLAAEDLAVSVSQLTRFLNQYPKAAALVAGRRKRTTT